MLTALQPIIDFVFSPRMVVGLVWTGMAAITVALFVLMRTRWGHEQPLRKCVVLSLFVHLLFIAYATTVHIVRSHPGRGRGHGTAIKVTDLIGYDTVDAKGAEDGRDGGREKAPWDAPTESPRVEPKLVDVPPDDSREPIDEIVPVEAAAAPTLPHMIVGAHNELPLAPPETTITVPTSAPEPIDVATSEPAPAAQAPVDARPSELEQPPEISAPTAIDKPNAAAVAALATASAAALATDINSTATNDALLAGETVTRTESPLPAHEADIGVLVAVRPRPVVTAVPPPAPRDPNAPLSAYEVPEMYRERSAANRLRIAESYGGSAQTEAAVNAALDWLAKHQSADGRWDASDHGGGRETHTLGQDRKQAGAQADTGVTGLALLTFLAAGHTHQSGGHADVVKRGIDFLIASQGPDGNLAGNAETFAHMYCHGMATLSLCEASAMTGDKRLASPVRRAIAYTIAAQNLATGGWRYKPPYPRGERGDTSQLGWQLMALKSAEYSGLPIPESTRQGIVRYLNSVSAGTSGGLASYRPEERPTHSMTAEALVCREFLDLLVAGAGDEARDFLLGQLPGQGTPNFYYWYYGTLAMFRMQGPRWVKWNEAVSTALVNSQSTSGDASGSWDPDPLWGGYGGRVFSTSLGALCLEVYYRYLPLYNTGGGEATARRQKPVN
ncbi:MAG TPA: hypothetical protein VGN12_30105 [Pirellulales bacterium]|jgi:hypothetical protein